MSASVQRLPSADAYDLIYPDYLAKLPKTDQETMHRSMCNSSRVYIGCADGHIACVWGLIPPTLLSDRAYLWLFTTKHLDQHVFLLVRHSQRMIQFMLEEFPIIVGHCQINNHKAIRWLRWLGADFGEASAGFVPFVIKAKVNG